MPAAEGITYQQTTTTTTTKEVKEKKEKPKSKTAQQVKAEVGSVLCWCLLWGEIIVCPSGDNSRSCLVLCVPTCTLQTLCRAEERRGWQRLQCRNNYCIGEMHTR